MVIKVEVHVSTWRPGKGGKRVPIVLKRDLARFCAIKKGNSVVLMINDGKLVEQFPNDMASVYEVVKLVK